MGLDLGTDIMRITRSPQLGLLALSLLCTLLPLAQSLYCEVCKESGPACTGKLKLCEAEKDACVTIVGLSSTGGKESLYTSKNCMKYKDCYSGFISTTLLHEEHMVSNSYCCQEDGCNQGSIPTPKNNRTLNGLRCPSCMAAFQETCPGDEMVQCMGHETQCVYFSGTVQTEKLEGQDRHLHQSLQEGLNLKNLTSKLFSMTPLCVFLSFVAEEDHAIREMMT